MSRRFNWFAFRRDLEELVGRPVSDDEARLVRRRLVRHHSLQEAQCNGFQRPDYSEDVAARDRAEREEANLERHLREFFGDRLRHFGGDPRGGTVKLKPLEGGDLRLTYFATDWGGDLIYTGKELK